MLHGMLNLGCEQVMRFLGKQFNGQFGGEVVTDWRRRSEGVRLKHWVDLNSIKLDNCLNVLRPETTIHDAEDLKVFRTPETRPQAPMAWYPLRRGVADLYRRAQISRAANDRYLTALAAASITTPLAEEAVKVCRPVRHEQRRHRALNPFGTTDAQLLAAVNRGEWALKGFRNRDIRALLFGQTNDETTALPSRQGLSAIGIAARPWPDCQSFSHLSLASHQKGPPRSDSAPGGPTSRHGQAYQVGSMKISSQLCEQFRLLQCRALRSQSRHPAMGKYTSPSMAKHRAYVLGLCNHLPAPSVPHHLENPFDQELVYLMGGENREFDIAEFPRFGKRMTKSGGNFEVYDVSNAKPFGPLET